MCLVIREIIFCDCSLQLECLTVKVSVLCKSLRWICHNQNGTSVHPLIAVSAIRPNVS